MQSGTPKLFSYAGYPNSYKDELYSLRPAAYRNALYWNLYSRSLDDVPADPRFISTDPRCAFCSWSHRHSCKYLWKVPDIFHVDGILAGEQTLADELTGVKNREVGYGLLCGLSGLLAFLLQHILNCFFILIHAGHGWMCCKNYKNWSIWWIINISYFGSWEEGKAGKSLARAKIWRRKIVWRVTIIMMSLETTFRSKWRPTSKAKISKIKKEMRIQSPSSSTTPLKITGCSWTK